MKHLFQLKMSNGKSNVDLSTLPDGNYVLYYINGEETKDIPYYQRLYGALKNTLYKEGETGYTPKEIHKLAKDEILPKLILEDEYKYFNPHSKFLQTGSTSQLTLEGWQRFIQEFKIFAQEHFNCYI